MLPATACPSQESLNQFLLGLASESDSEQVALHLLECSHCAALANNLAPSDDVVEILSRAIRIQEGLAPHVEAGRLRDLLDRVLGAAAERVAQQVALGAVPGRWRRQLRSMRGRVADSGKGCAGCHATNMVVPHTTSTAPSRATCGRVARCAGLV